jgi:hypothetical protein
LAVRIIASVILLVVVWASVNWIVQAVRKPSEVFFPVSGSLAKAPAETWRQYGPLFVKHSTAVVTPELLAALAQVEGSGNPVARTYWRWRFSWNPFELYRPASSAVGMFQIVIHLCGGGVGNAYARSGFQFRAGQRCGDHDVHRYLAQVNVLKRHFARLAAAG